MGWYDPDPYSQPEKFGLTIIDAVDDPEADYSFSLFVVWQHEDGRVFYGIDSGCSCPSPFEDFKGLDDLTLLTADTWAEFQSELEQHCVRYDYAFDVEPTGAGWVRDDLESASISRKRWRRPEPDKAAAEKTELLAKVSTLVPRA